jgi:hypothetical protein
VIDDEAGEPSGPTLDEIGPQRFYRGVVTRVYHGSESGTLRSDGTGREYRFSAPFVEICGVASRVADLHEGMRVGFDLSWTSSGRRVSVIRVYE